MEIGDVIEINGITVRVDNSESFYSCVGCHFNQRNRNSCNLGDNYDRCVTADVIYTKVEVSPEKHKRTKKYELAMTKQQFIKVVSKLIKTNKR